LALPTVGLTVEPCKLSASCCARFTVHTQAIELALRRLLLLSTQLGGSRINGEERDPEQDKKKRCPKPDSELGKGVSACIDGNCLHCVLGVEVNVGVVSHVGHLVTHKSYTAHPCLSRNYCYHAESL